jgi:hypothetical protein
VPCAVQGSLKSGARHSDASAQQQPQQAAPATGAQPIIGEVVDRPTSGAAERPASSQPSAAAKGSMPPGNARRPSRFAAQRTGGESAVSSGDSSMLGAQPANGSGSADGVNSAAADAAAEQVMAAAAQRLEADMADINDEKAQGSDAESEGSEQSTFDSINMASALDMGQSWCYLTSPSRGPAASLTPTLWGSAHVGIKHAALPGVSLCPCARAEASDDEAGVSDGMPRPFARLSNFGQLYTALDGWVTRASLDFVQVRRHVDWTRLMQSVTTRSSLYGLHGPMLPVPAL